MESRWLVEPHPAQASEVHVTFAAQSPDRPLVELDPRHLGRDGAACDPARDAGGSPDEAA